MKKVFLAVLALTLPFPACTSSQVTVQLELMGPGGFGETSAGVGIEVELVPLVATTTAAGTTQWRPVEDVTPLVTISGASRLVEFSWDRTRPYLVRASSATGEDSHCWWLGSERVIDGSAHVTLELGVACE